MNQMGVPPSKDFPDPRQLLPVPNNRDAVMLIPRASFSSALQQWRTLSDQNKARRIELAQLQHQLEEAQVFRKDTTQLLQDISLIQLTIQNTNEELTALTEKVQSETQEDLLAKWKTKTKEFQETSVRIITLRSLLEEVELGLPVEEFSGSERELLEKEALLRVLEKEKSDLFEELIQLRNPVRAPKVTGPVAGLHFHPNSPLVKLEFPNLRMEFPAGSSPLDLSKLPNGSHKVRAYTQTGSDPKIFLKETTITKRGYSISPEFVDLGATVTKVRFLESDSPVAGATVSGTFQNKQNQKHKISGETTAKGDFIVPLPSGELQVTSETPQGKQYSISVKVPEAPVVNSQKEATAVKPMISTVSQKASVAGAVSKASKLVILGDTSGSMISGSPANIELLKKTYTAHVEKYVREKRPVAIASWDDQIYWSHNGQWITSEEDLGSVKKWIAQQAPRGGNEMEKAILSALKMRPDLQEILVICDGDVTPFNHKNWRDFRSKYPKVLFHFIALGTGSDFSAMQSMAAIGGGSFTQTNV